MRYIKNSIYGGGGTAYVTSNNMLYQLAYLNSKVAVEFLSMVSPTLNYEAGHIMSIPLKLDRTVKVFDVCEIAKDNLRESKLDWDSFETSWSFTKNPIV